MLKRYPTILLLVCYVCIGCSVTSAQKLQVIRQPSKHVNMVKENENNKLVNIETLLPGLVTDIRYATTNNFTGQVLYDEPLPPYLRKPAALALAAAQKELMQMGYNFKVFDAYRPYQATVKMWNLIKDERYVANPATGSGHNRGISIDLTLVNYVTGAELDMGTPYDHFSDTAHHSFNKLPEHVLQNRKLLKETMEKYGFRALETEWWHYSFISDEKFAVLDLDAKQLSRL